jgi:FKBP-type peptidyl-prolyl cis-trans isomerase FkpA
MKIIFRSFTILCVAVICAIGCKKTGSEQTTSNGYKYIVHKRGSGPQVKEGDFMFYNITIKADSEVLQSVNDPNNNMQFPKDWKANKAQSHFFEALYHGMKGDSISVIVPIDSLPKGDPKLVGKKALTFNFKITNVMDSTAYEAFVQVKRKEMEAKAEENKKKIPTIVEILKKSVADYKANGSSVKSTSTGLKYIIHKQGTGVAAKAGEKASVHYYGTLLDGTMFDNSFERGAPFDVTVGQGAVIPGWDEALALLPKGTEATLLVPPTLGYGATDNGPIPANSVLAFYVEIN